MNLVLQERSIPIQKKEISYSAVTPLPCADEVGLLVHTQFINTSIHWFRISTASPGSDGNERWSYSIYSGYLFIDALHLSLSHYHCLHTGVYVQWEICTQNVHSLYLIQYSFYPSLCNYIADNIKLWHNTKHWTNCGKNSPKYKKKFFKRGLLWPHTLDITIEPQAWGTV